MFSLYPGSSAYQAWFHRSDLLHRKEGALAMAFPATDFRETLSKAMPRYTALFEAGQFFRRGGHTLTGVLNLDGRSVFGKYVDFRRKSFTSRLRYCCMPSRGLWSAFMADVLLQAGIATPRVLGAGETRTGLLIAESYAFTEVLSVNDAVQLMKATGGRRDAVEETARLLMEGLKRLHAACVTHGDLKLDNIYAKDDAAGFWDLDSAMYWPAGISDARRHKNVARLAADIVLHLDDQCGDAPHCFAADSLAALCARQYGDTVQPSRIVALTLEWLKSRPLKYVPLCGGSSAA